MFIEILTAAVLFVLTMIFFVIAGALGAVAFHYIGNGILALMYPIKRDGEW